MSRPYKIRISRDITRVVHVEDGVTSHLELLPILEAARMRALLEEQLQADGFDIEGDVATKEVEDELDLVVNMATSEVSLKIQGEHHLEKKVDAVVYGDTDYGDNSEVRKRATEGLERDANRELDADAKELQRMATAKLEGKLRDMGREINRITGEVTKAALKEKAASMGDIDAMSEGTDGSMEIKVRL